jgi:FlaA1/EpsC-like NDP-sugar epimerase
VITDLIFINAALVFSFFLRFDTHIPPLYWGLYVHSFWLYSFMTIGVFYFFEFYHHDWRYMTVRNIFRIFASVNISIAIYIICLYFINNLSLPRTVTIMTSIITTGLVGGSRLLIYLSCSYWKKLNNMRNCRCKKAIIIGAGSCGELLVRDMEKNGYVPYRPVGFLDDDLAKKGIIIREVPVLGKIEEVKRWVREKKAEMIVIAIPSIPVEQMKKIIFLCEKAEVELKRVPSVFNILDGSLQVSQVGDVKPEDVLDREVHFKEIAETAKFLEGKIVMVTGAGGSIGAELCRQIIDFKPRHLILLENSEHALYVIYMELLNKCSSLTLKPVIANIQHKTKMEDVFREHIPQIVFHAAAYKHVPLMEESMDVAIKNNICGTKNVATLAVEYKAEKFVMISTDKAVNPTSIMGVTKRVAEKVVQSLDKGSKTCFCAVRFGNVLDSSGSVLPLFKKQIAQGGPLTVTHPEVIRYFMTIPEAVHLVLTAGSISKGGELFVLNMGKPVKILNMAESLIRLSGLRPYKDIDIKFIGLRPGEKLYEELLTEKENVKKTENDKIFTTFSAEVGKEPLFEEIEKLWHLADKQNLDVAMTKLKQLVPEWNMENKKGGVFCPKI